MVDGQLVKTILITTVSSMRKSTTSTATPSQLLQSWGDQLANNTPPLGVTGSVIAPSASTAAVSVMAA